MRTIVAVFALLFLDRLDFLIKFKGDWETPHKKIIAALWLFGMVACVFQDIRDMISGKKK